MRALIVTLYVAVFLALFGLDYAIDRYYDSQQETGTAPYPGYRAALDMAAADIAPVLADPVRAQHFLRRQALDFSLEALDDVPLPPPLIARRDKGEIITLDSDSGISLYRRIPGRDAMLRLDIPAPENTGAPRLRLGLTMLFYAGVAAILMLWTMPLLRGIRQLTRAARSVGEGKLDTQAPVRRGDYLKPLKQEFNAMTARLRELDSQNRLLTQAVSHELRTPLSRMRFALDMLETRRDDARREQDIRRIERDMDAIESLISELLSYASLEKGVELDRQQVNIEALIAERIELRAARDCPVNFHARRPENQALVDPQYFAKVLDNLIRNACHHARSQVEIRCDWSASEVVIRVEDDGLGVDEGERESIFKPFVQSKTTPARTQSTGFGLGLAIVARIVEWHGGRVSVETSQQLGGAKFVVAFPRSMGAQEHQPGAQSSGISMKYPG